MPDFFRNGEVVPAHCVYDPDLFKNRATPHLKNAEYSEHYLDQELLEGRALPPTRYEFLGLCLRAGLDPTRVGLVPYAVAEWSERLAMAFAEHRKWPDDQTIRSKCLVYAGLLAHYAEDMCQPLHLTIHFDGRARADGSSPKSGIHAKVDGLVQRLELDPRRLAKDQEVAAFDSLMPAILKEIERGRSLIDRVYELEEKLESGTAPEVRAFAWERARAATRFTASLYLTAWELSAQVELPGWHKRE